MKSIILIFVLLFFSSCSSIKSFDVQDEISLNKKEFTYSLSGCINNSYIAKNYDPRYGKLFIEEIVLNPNCNWNGLSRGYFENLFKRTMNFESMKVIERFNYASFEFTTYLINDEYHINLIFYYGVNSDTFILDYKGLYFEQKVKVYDPNYINKSKNEKRFRLDYDNSLVKMDIVNNYFEKERLELFE